MADVHIIGGGPAGCFAGISACLNGKSALLSEEHRKIGEPEACSGLISKSGLDSLLPHVNYGEIELNRITAAKFISGKQSFTIRPRDEIAILVSRCGLDELAAASFERQGGRIELGKKVTRNFKSRCVIGADGPASSVADFFGFPRIGSYVACMQGNFKYRCENPSQTEIYLSSKEFPGFFGWAIPINEGEAKVGLGVSLPRHPLAYYRRFISRLGISSPPSYEFAAVIPTSVRRRTGMRKAGYSVVLAGDAAGQVKATTGGGIFFGAQCGMIAGRNFSEPEKYEREWKGKFGLDLALHRKFRSALNIAGGEPSPLLLSAAKAMFFEDLLSERGKMDRWGAMLSPSTLLAYAGIVGKRFTGAMQ